MRAVNAAVQDAPVKSKFELLGKSLLIPLFFIGTGFRIDPSAFAQSIVDHYGLICGVVGALLLGKWIAAEVAGRAFAYSRATRWTMWSLTLPQVAATLAATIVAFDTVNGTGQRLIDVHLVNVVLVLMLTTSIMGPFLPSACCRSCWRRSPTQSAKSVRQQWWRKRLSTIRMYLDHCARTRGDSALRRPVGRIS